MASFGWTVIPSHFTVPSTSKSLPSVLRFFDLELFLKEHPGEFDRIAITDFRDVAWFADGFACLDPEELFVNKECTGNPPRCNKYKITNTANSRWIAHCYGLELRNHYAEMNREVLNVGFVFANITNMMKYLDVYISTVKEKDKKLWDYWGMDQSTLNYIYYEGKLKNIKITINDISQKMAFGYNYFASRYDSERKIVLEMDSDCSPVIRHKMKGYL